MSLNRLLIKCEKAEERINKKTVLTPEEERIELDEIDEIMASTRKILGLEVREYNSVSAQEIKRIQDN